MSFWELIVSVTQGSPHGSRPQKLGWFSRFLFLAVAMSSTSLVGLGKLFNSAEVVTVKVSQKSSQTPGSVH